LQQPTPVAEGLNAPFLVFTPAAVHRLAAPLALAAVPPGRCSLRERYFVSGL